MDRISRTVGRALSMAACVSVLFSVTACDTWWSEEPVQVVLPQLPAATGRWIEAPAFRLEWFDTTGEPRCSVVLPDQQRIWIDLSRLPGSPVLAYPILTPYGDFARPAGGVVPDSFADGNRFVLSWDDGFLASVLSDLSSRGISTVQVNTAKLARRIGTVAGFDSWRVDRVALATAVAADSLSADSVQLGDIAEVELSLPPGRWMRQDLRALPLVVGGTSPAHPQPGSGGPTATAEFAVGYHRLMEVATGRIRALSVGESGAVAMLPIWPRY